MTTPTTEQLLDSVDAEIAEQKLIIQKAKIKIVRLERERANIYYDAYDPIAPQVQWT